MSVDCRYKEKRQLAHALLKGNLSWVPSLKTSKNPSILKDVRESQIINPKCQIPNFKSQIPNFKSQIPNPK